MAKEEVDVALKFDSDAYEKVDLSLIPLEFFNVKLSDELKRIHGTLNSKEGINPSIIRDVYDSLVSEHGEEPLAAALGYGEIKYARDNWRKGLEVKRSLKAALRHLFAMCKGETHDGNPLGPYDKGTPHAGSAMFGVMCALVELSKPAGTLPKPWEQATKSLGDLGRSFSVGTGRVPDKPTPAPKRPTTTSESGGRELYKE